MTDSKPKRKPKRRQRKPIDAHVQAQVLLKCRRRCCLCWYLDDDRREKVGQVAHVDQDASNADEDNLVFLCFDHHDKYDSSTRQSKNYTPTEMREYRTMLHEHWKVRTTLDQMGLSYEWYQTTMSGITRENGSGEGSD